MRIGIIEEHLDFSRLLKLSLQMAFYEKAKHWAREAQPLLEGLDVEEFHHWDEALTGVAQATIPWDLLFVDLPRHHPKAMAFVSMCSRFYRDRYHQLIVVTERGYTEGIENGMAAGADAYLYKPFTPKEIFPFLLPGILPLAPPMPDMIQPGGIL